MLRSGEATPDYIAQHEKDEHVDELFIAEVLFVMVAHHRHLHKRADGANCLPLRFAVCKLHTPEERLSYPGSRVWDIDMTKPARDPQWEAYPVEAALLREVLACRVLSRKDGTSAAAPTVKKRKRDVDAARSNAISAPEEEAPEKQILLDDAAKLRLIRVHHQSMVSKNLTTG